MGENQSEKRIRKAEVAIDGGKPEGTQKKIDELRD